MAMTATQGRQPVDRSKQFLILIAFWIAGGAVVCQAQSSATVPELITDRPDFTESSEVVGHRVVQVETGLTFEQDDPATRQVTAPQMLVRVGRFQQQRL